MHTETEAPGFGDFKEVGKTPDMSRAHCKRVTKKPGALICSTYINEKSNGSTEDAPVSDQDKQDVIDSQHQYALRTAKIGGDALTHMACAAGIKDVFDYPEQMDHKEA